jgi:hypothetical protein
MEQQPMLKHDFRDLATVARGADYKVSCLDHFGSVQAVQKFLLQPGDIDLLQNHVAQQPAIEHGTADTQQPSDETTQQFEQTIEHVQDAVGDIARAPADRL